MSETLEKLLNELLVHLKLSNDLQFRGHRQADERAAWRKRWPALKAGNSISEVFQRNLNIIGKEPTFSEVEAFFEPMQKGRLYARQMLPEYVNSDVRTTEAYLFFADIALLICADDKSYVYKLEPGKQAPTSTEDQSGSEWTI